MSDQPALSYLQGAAQGSSPIGQVILLYDTILRDFARAMAALESGDIEGRVNQLNHALTVIGYLQSVLDHEQGGQAAKEFERFYNVTRELIVQANAKGTRQSLEELSALYSKVRGAWYQIDQKLTVRDPDAQSTALRGDASGPRAGDRMPGDDDAPRRQWNS